MAYNMATVGSFNPLFIGAGHRTYKAFQDACALPMVSIPSSSGQVIGQNPNWPYGQRKKVSIPSSSGQVIGLAGKRPDVPNAADVFQSPLHRGRSSDVVVLLYSSGSSWDVSIPSSSGQVIGRSKRSSPSRSKRASFNPLFIGAGHRTFWTFWTAPQHCCGFNPLFIGARLRTNGSGRWKDV